MIKLHRPKEPMCLEVAREEQWGARFAEAFADKPKSAFVWRKYNRSSVLKIIRPMLERMTANHCSYCDGFPLGVLTPRTVDHFKPKSVYPELVYEWQNLYLCCEQCQRKKSDHFHDELLRPDENTYRFIRFFRYEPFSGGLGVNPYAKRAYQQAALITIGYFDLNAPDLRADRKRWFRSHQGRDFDELPYRYLYLNKL